MLKGIHQLTFRCTAALAVALVTASLAFAQAPPRTDVGIPAAERPNVIKDIDIEQKLDQQVPLDLAFKDETGRDIKLHEYFHQGRPIILVLAYYECPMLCTQVLNGLVTTLRPLKFNVGQEFDVVVVSFDPKETPGLARDKKAAYVDDYKRPGTERGWHFLTGSQASIEAVTNAVGFKYKYDEAIDQYAHAAGITVLTPEGKVSRYFYGIEYSTRDLRMGLVDASANKIGTLADRVMYLCYHYDPSTGQYGLLTMRLLKAGGLLTMATLGTFWAVMIRRERRKAYAS
jgi:protein SCO1